MGRMPDDSEPLPNQKRSYDTPWVNGKKEKALTTKLGLSLYVIPRCKSEMFQHSACLLFCMRPKVETLVVPNVHGTLVTEERLTCLHMKSCDGQNRENHLEFSYFWWKELRKTGLRKKQRKLVLAHVTATSPDTCMRLWEQFDSSLTWCHQDPPQLYSLPLGLFWNPTWFPGGWSPSKLHIHTCPQQEESKQNCPYKCPNTSSRSQGTCPIGNSPLWPKGWESLSDSTLQTRWLEKGKGEKVVSQGVFKATGRGRRTAVQDKIN